MKIEKYEKIGKDKYRLFLDNGEIIDTYDEVILKNHLLLEKEITPETYSAIFSESKIYEHYLACLKYISVRVRSTKEIEDYLKKRQIELDDIEVIIQKLKDERALDDDYFCKCFIKDKLRFTTMGEYRIILELKKHRIDSQVIEKYSYLWNEDVMREKINKLIEKGIHSNHKLDQVKLRNKLYNHLLGLGYSSSLIVEMLNQRF